MRQIFAPLALALAVSSPFSWAAEPSDSLTARTATGVYTGAVNPDFPNVREFRSIPFAQPPTGPRRWLPPQALTPSGKHYYAHRFPPPCPQYLKKNVTVWNSNVTDFAPHHGTQDLLAGTMLETSDEDCLHLAVWTPLNVSTEAKLPVAIFLPGGSFINGGVTVDYQMPAPFVARHQELMVVTVGYRLNIFGFPKAAGLEDQNLGILDQRMAVEWLHGNVAAFGGDPERMILWGQSAGAVAADLHNYAFHDNPLVRGFYLQSGTAFVAAPKEDPLYSNFSFVARGVGCDFPRDPVAELDCMRRVPAGQITNYLGQYGQNGSKPALNFQCVRDDKIYFGNYTPRAEQGLVSKLPVLLSTTANEQSSLTAYPTKNVTAGPWQAGVDKDTLDTFVCPASNTTDHRARLGLTTYRYQFAGNISSVTPLGWMGAYHAVDIPFVFGTYRRREGAGAFEAELANTMQDYLAAFVVDPEAGLKKKGWLSHTGRVADSGFMMRFAQGDKVSVNISSLEVDRKCIGKGDYDSAPK